MHLMLFINCSILKPESAPTSPIVTKDNCTTTIEACFHAACETAARCSLDTMSILSNEPVVRPNWLLWATGMMLQVHCVHFIFSSIFKPEPAPPSSIITQDNGTTTIESCLHAADWACHPLRLGFRLNTVLTMGSNSGLVCIGNIKRHPRS
jgi:hypothetical protein